MSKEKEMIKIINKQMLRDSTQLNALFESDSEIITFNGRRLAYNIDEFSEEDMLREEDPYTLGWNMAVGSISDILASGGSPKFYAHSLVIKKSWTKEYVEKLSIGISDVLKKLKVSFIGGDFGISETWRYTGSVIGELEDSPMLRSGAKVGDLIFISGKIGIGNIEAALKLYSENNLVKNITKRFKNHFRLRSKEAFLIKEYSRCCIDTSDGVFNALNTISEISKIGFEVGNLPYEKSGILLAKLLNVPKELLFLGECGEYELLFTISKETYEEFLKKSNEMELKFYKIGEIKEYKRKLLYEANRKIDLRLYDLSARDYGDTKEYLRDVIDFINLWRSR
ncbi:MAG: thiamine-monophosphate kinase [Halanaerobiales bacterium]|nr:thiamine-monophosphate kinase [Halanaerobiales bacterium]